MNLSNMFLDSLRPKLQQKLEFKFKKQLQYDYTSFKREIKYT